MYVSVWNMLSVKLGEYKIIMDNFFCILTGKARKNYSFENIE